ncbi:hypothetical protein DC347_00095 [Pseudarthrobacter sp. AG30]|nr:hypothetical protein DC347_00095 [Pseudarthrobacter sp. AG30]
MGAAARAEPALRLDGIRMRDPFILQSAPGGFVLFGTSDENVWGGPATGFDCYTSEDLEHWDGPFAAFRPPADFWADTQFWAPEVYALDGRFFMFATLATSSRSRPRGVVVLAADAATGPYRPWSDGPVTPAAEPCLDGTLHVDDAGARWLVYSRGAEGTREEPGTADGRMCAVRLSHDLRAAVGEPFLLFTASSAPWARPLRLPDGAEPPPGAERHTERTGPAHSCKNRREQPPPASVRCSGGADLQRCGTRPFPGGLMPYTVDFKNVSTVGLESSPVADALAGLRANEARYYKNKYDHDFTMVPADEAPETVDYVHNILSTERNLVISSKPLEVSSFEVDGLRMTYVFYESGLSINVMYGIAEGGKRAVGFKLSDGMDVPEELASSFKFARQKSKLAGTIRGSYFVIKGEY